MAGHSKWANIRHKKGRADAKRSKVFSRISKEIVSAVKVGGADAKGNPRLRLAIQKARAVNYPSDNVDRLIKKATSDDQADYTEMTYELYGYGGVGIIADVMTDNKNRISSEIRIATNKRGGNVADPGSVAFNFDRKGVLQVPSEGVDEDTLFLAATEAGAEDFENTGECYMITTDPAELYAVKDALSEQGFEAENASLEMLPKVFIECDVDTAKSNLALIDWLEGIDDIDALFHNMSMPDDMPEE